MGVVLWISLWFSAVMVSIPAICSLGKANILVVGSLDAL